MTHKEIYIAYKVYCDLPSRELHCGLEGLPDSLQPALWMEIPCVRTVIHLNLEKLNEKKLVSENARLFLSALHKHITVCP